MTPEQSIILSVTAVCNKYGIRPDQVKMLAEDGLIQPVYKGGEGNRRLVGATEGSLEVIEVVTTILKSNPGFKFRDAIQEYKGLTPDSEL
jgi:hypothetical protein